MAIESAAEAREALRAVGEFIGDSFYVVQNDQAADARLDVHELIRTLSLLRLQKQP